MDALSSYMASTHAALLQTMSVAVADMAINGTANQMSGMMNEMLDSVQTVQQQAPAVDGVGQNLDVRA